jgi:uncharacterized membrane protein YfcA
VEELTWTSGILVVLLAIYGWQRKKEKKRKEERKNKRLKF